MAGTAADNLTTLSETAKTVATSSERASSELQKTLSSVANHSETISGATNALAQQIALSNQAIADQASTLESNLKLLNTSISNIESINERFILQNAFQLDYASYQQLANNHDLTNIAEDTLFSTDIGPSSKRRALEYLFSHAKNFEYLQVNNTRVSDANLLDHNWEIANFNNVRIFDATASNTVFRDSTFQNTDFRRFTQNRGGLINSKFTDSSLYELETWNANFYGTTFDRSSILNGNFKYDSVKRSPQHQDAPGLYGVRFRDSKLIWISFDESLDHQSRWEVKPNFESYFFNGFPQPTSQNEIGRRKITALQSTDSCRNPAENYYLSGISAFSNLSFEEDTTVDNLIFKASYVTGMTVKNTNSMVSLQASSLRPNSDYINTSDPFDVYYSLLFDHTIFCHSYFHESKLPRLTFQDSFLRNVEFVDTQLHEHNIRNSEMIGVSYIKSDLHRSHWTQSWIVNATFEETNLENSSWENIYLLGTTTFRNPVSLPKYVENIKVRGSLRFEKVDKTKLKIEDIKLFLSTACHHTTRQEEGLLIYSDEGKLRMRSTPIVSIEWNDNTKDQIALDECIQPEFK